MDDIREKFIELVSEYKSILEQYYLIQEEQKQLKCQMERLVPVIGALSDAIAEKGESEDVKQKES